jgi:hypothetical protein
MTTINEIKKNYGEVFRRAYIKRKLATTGQFEDDWVEVTKDVRSFGKIKTEIDETQYSVIRFNDLMIKMNNESGRYNPEDDEFSLWFGYGSQQRSLLKIEAGFQTFSTSTGGIVTRTEFPTDTSCYVGIISGDVPLYGTNEVTLPVRPLLQIFRDYPARNLTGWTSTGLTASQFITMLRDQTDGSGSFIFRPFLGNTTSNWNITSTSQVYANLNTATAAEVYDANAWDIVEKLAATEDKVVYIDRSGVFNFKSREVTSTAQFIFHFIGAGFPDTEYGNTVKKISRFGKKQMDYYSRVEVKFRAEDTITSVRVRESSFTVSGSNDPWNMGHRTLQFENLWIANTAAADTILDNIFNQVTVVKDQLEFSSTFVTHLGILDKIRVSYDSGDGDVTSRWDLADWAASDTNTSADLIWTKSGGDAIRLVNRDFKILALTIDLDKLETQVTALTV